MHQRQRRLDRPARALLAALLALSLVAGLAAGVPVPAPPASAAFPGANGKIAFSRLDVNDIDTSGMYVMDADGSNQTRIYPGGIQPAWSPDGTRIAFVSSLVETFDIYVMDADGSNPTRLTSHPEEESLPTWSPDGTRIAFDRRGDDFNRDIYVMHADGGNPTNLTNHPDDDAYSSWSPDGTRIAFTSNRDGNYEIYAMDADGSNPTRLTNHPQADYSTSWSPDGTRIAFTRDAEIYVMNADGSNQTRLTNQAVIAALDPDWSPDGSRIVFNVVHPTADGANYEIFVMDADGSNQTNLTNHPAFDLYPAWQPLPGCALLIVPGIAGTYAADTENDLLWLLNRGAHPNQTQIDPLGRVYDDLIQTLENTGYVEGEDLFAVTYDWRLPPGPTDGVIDGQITGLSGSSITDGTFEHSVDYFGHFLKAAVEAHEEESADSRLDCVDVITHSTGGLVTRAYVQSTAYQDTFMTANGERELPRVNEFIMIGVPNRGASKPWNPLHDNWIIDPAYRVVLSKIANRAWEKVVRWDTPILGPDYTITRASIADEDGNPDPERFIRQYIATIRALLATYDFLDSGSGFEDLNSDPEWRNLLLLDLNDGFDLEPTSDPSPFADESTVTVIYGTDLTTATAVIERTGAAGGEGAILPFSAFSPNDAQPGETWYDDIEAPISGDGTVPIDSAAGQFFGDPRVTLRPFSAANTSGKTDHTGIVGNPDVQALILETLGVSYEASDIASGTGASFTTALSVIFDPVEGFVVDGDGNRLGYSQATGTVTEIPGSVWFGNTDGFGLVIDEPLVEPLRLELSGLGEDHYVMVAYEQDGESGGVISEGFLEDGEVVSLPITDSGPEITVPAGMTVDATSRHGAFVSYRAAAKLADGSVTPVTCAPASGSQFRIGTTTVTCSASDGEGGEASASFAVHVRGVDEQLERLRERVLETPMSARTRQTLLRSLDAAVAALDARQTTNACNNLLSFARDAQHNGDILLTMGARLALQADANRIRAVLGCRGAAPAGQFQEGAPR